MPTRSEALRVAWEAAATEISFEDFKIATRQWYVKPLTQYGQLIGAIVSHETEVHACILKRWRGKWLSRRLLREIIGGIVRKYGYATTCVPINHALGKRLVEGLGFELVSTDNGWHRYRTRSMKWVS